MKSILEELYYGNLNPHDDFHPENPDYHEDLLHIANLEKKLAEKLDEKGRALLETIVENCRELHRIGLAESFVCGYRLGTQLLIDALTEKPTETTPRPPQ